ncbi:MAG: hypothetical protein LBC53_03765 [Spirochaetaceae bacterium]|jgi:hypothetical protein|nr:hypothetical protein [Spirochaetaceae bacterium]
MKKITPAIFMICMVFALLGCESKIETPQLPEKENPAGGVNSVIYIDAENELDETDGVTGPGVYPLEFEAASEVEIKNLQNKDVYLVMVNFSGSQANGGKIVDSWLKTSATTNEEQSASVKNADTPAQNVQNEVTPIRYDNMEAAMFNPPPIKRTGTVNNALSSVSINGKPQQNTGIIYIPGQTSRTFWIRRKKNEVWYQLNATLRAANEFCHVWVADENFDAMPAANSSINDNKVNEDQALAIAQKFADIYEKTTGLFGYEYGGGPEGGGGIDNLKEVQIFIHDIYEDFTPSQVGGTIGYFWSKDEYTQVELESIDLQSQYKSNYAEMFYMDAHFLDRFPETTYSTLIHEFQHMIHYNQKKLTHGLNSSLWYNEMLSMLAEDVICEFINIKTTSEAHPINGRIPLFLSSYNTSAPSDWVNSSNSDELYSYSSAYAFGAYLARNFGGAALIKEMMNNNAVDAASIEQAVNNLTGGKWTFKKLLQKYSETLVYTGAATLNASFNKTVKSGIGSLEYTFQGFNINNIKRLTKNDRNGSGAYFFSQEENWKLQNNTFILFHETDWRGITGSLNLNLKNIPGGTKLYIMLKKHT